MLIKYNIVGDISFYTRHPLTSLVRVEIEGVVQIFMSKTIIILNMQIKRPLRNLSHLILGSFFIFLICQETIIYQEEIFLSNQFTFALRAHGILAFWLFVFLAISILFEILRLKIKIINQWIFKNFPLIFKSTEQGRVSGLTHFLAAILITYLVFPFKIFLLAIVFLTFGDLAAVVIGQLFGHKKISFYLIKNQKTWAGAMGCFFISLISGFLLMKFLNLDISLLILVFGALTATAVELFFNYPDDNYTIPIISGGVMYLLIFLI